MWLEEDENGHFASMVTFYPEFDVEETCVKEYLFLIDRSSSMKGSTFGDAKRALALCVKCLPSDSTFNILDFGTHFEQLFVENVSASEINKTKALDHIKIMECNFGGTDLSKVLRSISILKKVSKAPPAQIFIITDGQICDPDSTLEIIRRNSEFFRIFPIGVGETCSRHMIRTLGLTGRGVAEFITPNKIPSLSKIQRHLSRAIQVRELFLNTKHQFFIFIKLIFFLKKKAIFIKYIH